MSEPLRVPMPRPMASIIKPDDVAAAYAGPIPTGRRFTLDVTDELLSRGARECLAYAFDDLCKRVAREQRPMLESQAFAWLSHPDNREKIDALVQEIFRETMRDWLTDVLNDSPLGQMRQNSVTPHV